MAGGYAVEELMAREDYRRKNQKELGERLEFTVESTSSSPEMGGFIEVQCCHNKLRLRWEGATEWHEIAWHDAIFALMNDPGLAHSAAIKELYEEAAERGYNDGLSEAIKVLPMRSKAAYI
jgi:hypothetical protein